MADQGKAPAVSELTSATLPREAIPAATVERPKVDPLYAPTPAWSPAPSAPPRPPPAWDAHEDTDSSVAGQYLTPPPVSTLICIALFLAGAPFAYYGGRLVYGGIIGLSGGPSGLFAELSLFVGYAAISAGLFVIFIGFAHAWVATALTQGRLVARPAGLLLAGIMAAALTYALIVNSRSVGLGGSTSFELDVLPLLILGLEVVAFAALAGAGQRLGHWLHNSGHRSNAMPTSVALGQAMSYYYVVGALAIAAVLFPFVSGSGAASAVVLTAVLIAVGVAVAAKSLEQRSVPGRIVVTLVAVVHCGLTVAGVVGVGQIAASGIDPGTVVALAWGPTVIALLWFGGPAIEFFMADSTRRAVDDISAGFDARFGPPSPVGYDQSYSQYGDQPPVSFRKEP